MTEQECGEFLLLAPGGAFDAQEDANMTEPEWLDCTDPGIMLKFIWQKVTNRKLRHFACAWCRFMSFPLVDQRCLTAVETGERYADGLIHEEERRVAWEAVQLVLENALAEKEWWQATVAVEAGRCIEIPKDLLVSLEHPGSVYHPQQLEILRDLFGPLPFRSVAIHSDWLAWNDGTVRRIAHSIYAGRAFDRLPILADALEDAGCTDADILAHCRSEGPHVRGCWVVDQLLGKE